ncbi:probable protein phosphatase 2C 55 [Gastrolobium bilobum]|uniref:probable protein phosphatase 2C 55 n=1 Tax=Gastrolobium bilobum TaxID=150636 RepID=UPI002AAFC4F8|nr:probable protein phosphatase 2C 55 [Gastrolobium bilobum]
MKGIDAGEYARELIKNATVAVKQEPKDFVNLKRVLSHAFMNTKAKGYSTASIVSLKKHVLHGVNVGDSGLMLFRNNRMLFRSPIQQQKFNTPYQLGNGLKTDSPDSAMEYQMKAEGRLMNVQECAKEIAQVARCLSICKLSGSPFEDACKKVGVNHKGGKIDDITVVVAHIII